MGGSGTSEYDGCHFVFLSISSKNDTFLGGDFLEMDIIGVTELLWRWGTKFDNWCSTNSSGNSLELPLRHDLNGHNLIFLEEMDSQLRHGARSYNDLNASFSKTLNEVFELLLLTLTVVLKLIGTSKKNSSLSLSLSNANHSSNDLRVVNTATKNLLDSNVVDIQS